MSAASELRDVQRKRSGLKKLIAGHVRLDNQGQAAELEKEFNKLTNKMRELEQQLLEEEREAKETAARVAKEAEKKKKDKKAANNEYERLMSNVKDVEGALSDVRKALSREKDDKKKSKLYQEEGKLKKLWSRLVMEAKHARDGK
jgi:chromosome segregation ATPase